jgi:hypothetical protein
VKLTNSAKPRFARKRLLLVSALASFATIGVVWTFLVTKAIEPPSRRINGHTVLRVRLGMTREDVENIFHAPPGEYSPYAELDKLSTPKAPPHKVALQWTFWGGERGASFVHFDTSGRVDDFECRIRFPPAKQPRVDYWMEAIRYKWLRL